MRRLWLTLAVLALAGCGSTPIQTPASIASPVKTNATGIGSRVVAGNTAITVNVVTDPAPTGGNNPKAGNRFVAVDATIENTGANNSSFSIYGAMLKTADDRLYMALAPQGMTPQPYLIGGAIAPAERIRGWVFFEIPADAKLATFRYQFATGAPVIINL